MKKFTRNSIAMLLGMGATALVTAVPAATLRVDGDWTNQTAVDADLGAGVATFGTDAFQTISAALTRAGVLAGTDTIQVRSATNPYREDNTIASSVIISGVDTGTGLPTVMSSNGVSPKIVFVVNFDDVTIENLNFNCYYDATGATGPQTRFAITNYPTSFNGGGGTGGTWFDPRGNTCNNLLIQGNTFTYNEESTSPSGGAYSFRRAAIGIASRQLGANDAVTIRDNSIRAGIRTSDSSTTYFSHGVALYDVTGSKTVGGATAADGNDIQVGSEGGVYTEGIIGATVLVRNNSFTGQTGVFNTGGDSGSLTYRENTFTPESTIYGAAAVQNLHGNPPFTLTYDGNTFNVLAQGAFAFPMAGIWLGGPKATVIKNNIFQPQVGATTFRHVVIDTAFSSSGTDLTVYSAIVQGNTFKGAAAPGPDQIGVEINRGEEVAGGAAPDFASLTIGGAGLENTFEAGLPVAINLTTGTPSRSLGGTVALPVTTNVNVADNYFAVSGGSKKPAAMTIAERVELEAALSHKLDNISTGYLTSVPGEVLAVPTLPLANAIAAIGSGSILQLAPGTHTAADIVVSNALSVIGSDPLTTMLEGTPGANGIILGVTTNDFSVTGVTFSGFEAAILAQQGLSGRNVTVDNCMFTNNEVAVQTAQGNDVLLTHNTFFDSTTAHVSATNQFASLVATNNVFYGTGAYFVPPAQFPGFTSPAPAYSSNWYPGFFDNTTSATSSTPYTIGSGGQVNASDSAPVAQFDRDADGVLDVFEIEAGSTTLYNNFDTDGNTVPDGAVIAGFDLTLDTDSDRFPDWYETNVGTDPNDSLSKPSLGDVVPNGSVTLSDAVRALQIINGALPLSVTSGNVNAINVSGNVTTALSLQNSLQILRFQAAIREQFPAKPGIN